MSGILFIMVGNRKRFKEMLSVFQTAFLRGLDSIVPIDFARLLSPHARHWPCSPQKTKLGAGVVFAF